MGRGTATAPKATAPCRPRLPRQAAHQTERPTDKRRHRGRARRRIAPEEEEAVEDGAEFSGRTVDEAVAEATAHYGVERSALDIEVLSQGSRGVFGIGAENARVRARLAGSS